MTNVTELASAQLNGADHLSVQLIREPGVPAAERTLSPSVIRIVWPSLPSVISPQRFPEVAAAIARSSPLLPPSWPPPRQGNSCDER